MKISDIRLRDIILKKYDYHCAYCGIEIDLGTLQIDHIEPKNRHFPIEFRGSDLIENFNPSCIICNSSKRCLSIEKWRSEIELKTKMCYKLSPTYRLLKQLNRIYEVSEPVIFYFEKMNNG